MQNLEKTEIIGQPETVALHRGYWGYNEMTPDELQAVTGAGDGGGCGGGCGGCGGEAGGTSLGDTTSDTTASAAAASGADADSTVSLGEGITASESPHGLSATFSSGNQSATLSNQSSGNDDTVAFSLTNNNTGITAGIVATPNGFTGSTNAGQTISADINGSNLSIGNVGANNGDW